MQSQMPATYEQLRHKSRVLAVHGGMICVRYTNKSWAKYQPNVFRDHVDWLLGDDVSDFRAIAAEGRDLVKLSWANRSVVRAAESEGGRAKDHHVRQHVGRQPGLRAHSDDLRTRHLVTLLTLGGPRAVTSNPHSKRQQQQPVQGQGNQQTGRERRR